MRHWRAAAGTAVVAAIPVVAATPAVADLMAAEAASTAVAEALTATSVEAVLSEVLAGDPLVVRAAARSAAQEVAHRPTRG